MTKKILSTQEQIEKLGYLTKEANKASLSEDLISKLGAFTIYAGLIDFYAIQAARLVEQIILKGQLHENKKPTFEPHEDSFFYDTQVNTRDIIKIIRGYLPFKPSAETKIENAQKGNACAKLFLDSLDKFLGYRNTLIHHLGNPKKDIDDIKDLCNKVINQFKKCMVNHKEFMDVFVPFSFSHKERNYFYKK